MNVTVTVWPVTSDLLCCSLRTEEVRRMMLRAVAAANSERLAMEGAVRTCLSQTVRVVMVRNAQCL